MLSILLNFLTLGAALVVLTYCEDKRERAKYMSDTYLKFESFSRLGGFAVIAFLLGLTVNILLFASGENLKDGELGCIRSPNHYHPTTCVKCGCK